MQVFLSHTSVDKDIVVPIGTFLKGHGFTVWLDEWCMTAGDSLITKVGQGIESSDSLVVCLTPASVESSWVRKEIATGLLMELAEEKGLGEKFIVPALLVPCKVPIMLRDKIYADFTNKPFSTGCEELIRGIMSSPNGESTERMENRILRSHAVSSDTLGKHAIVVEFGVRMSPTEGLHIGLDMTEAYDSVFEWFAPPNQPQIPSIINVAFTSSSTNRGPSTYVRKFLSPGIKSTLSYYLRFEGHAPFSIEKVMFLDVFNNEP